MAIEAVRIALRHMTPVILLADGYLSNAAEPWRIPDIADFPPIEAHGVPEDRGDLTPQRLAWTGSNRSRKAHR